MPVKKAAKKVKGLSRFTKLNIVIFSLLFAGIGTYLVINSRADVTNIDTWQDKYDITIGEKVILRVQSNGAQYCQFNAGDNAPTGQIYNVNNYQYRDAYPRITTTYSVQCFAAVAGGGYSSLTKAYAQVIVRPAAHISISPTTVTRGQSITVGIQADGATVCDWAKGDGLAGTPTYNVNVWQYKTVTPSATQSYEAWCYNAVDPVHEHGSSARPIPAIVTVNDPTPSGCGPGTLNNTCAGPTNVRASAVCSNGVLTGTAAWNATSPNESYWLDVNDSNSFVGGGTPNVQYWNKLAGAKVTSTSLSGLTSTVRTPSTFVMSPNKTYWVRVYSTGTSLHSATITFTTPNCSPPVCPPGTTGTYPNCKTIITDPVCPAGTTGRYPNCVKTITSTNTRVVTRTVTAPTNSSDQQRPTVPGNLQAEQAGNGEVDLTWDASTDNVGVVGYTVERSTDGTNWEMLSDSVTDTNYADNTAEFNTKYSYRVSAQDAAGNFSDYAVTDLSTNAFSPNVYADQDSTITSEDGIVTINVPAGALTEDAFCKITKDSVNSKPKGYKLAAGAYTLECKNEKGDSITSFEKEATVIMDLKDFKQYKKFAAYSIDGNNLSAISASFNDKDKTLTFKMKEFQTFAAYGSKGSSMWWIWLLVALLLAGLIFFIIRLRRSGGSDDSYYDTTNYVAMPPTPPVGPAGPQQYTSLPDMVAQGQQPPANGYPQDPYAGQPQYGQPPAGPGGQPPQYPGSNQYPPQYPPQQ